MYNPEYFKQSVDEVKDLVKDNSFFRGTPHYWVKASLPLAYCSACVEVVLKNSEQARIIYRMILNAWVEPEFWEFIDKVNSVIPESDRVRIEEAFKHPEFGFSPDPEKPFKQVEELFTDFELDDDLDEEDDTDREVRDDKNS